MEEKKEHIYEMYKRYRGSNLSPDGWFQHCFICSTITSYQIHYTTLCRTSCNYKIMVYMCPECKKHYNNKENFSEKYNNICFKIEEHIQDRIFP